MISDRHASGSLRMSLWRSFFFRHHHDHDHDKHKVVGPFRWADPDPVFSSSHRCLSDDVSFNILLRVMSFFWSLSMTPPSLLPLQTTFLLSSIIYLLVSLHTPTGGIRLFNNGHLFFFSFFLLYFFLAISISTQPSLSPNQPTNQPTSHFLCRISFLLFYFFPFISFLLSIIYILYTSHPYSYLNDSFFSFFLFFFFPQPRASPPFNRTWYTILSTPPHPCPFS